MPYFPKSPEEPFFCLKHTPEGDSRRRSGASSIDGEGLGNLKLQMRINRNKEINRNNSRHGGMTICNMMRKRE